MGIRVPVLSVKTEQATYDLHFDTRPPACLYVIVHLVEEEVDSRGTFRFRILNAADLADESVFAGLPEAIQDKILALREFGYDALTNDVAGGADSSIGATA